MKHGIYRTTHCGRVVNANTTIGLIRNDEVLYAEFEREKYSFIGHYRSLHVRSSTFYADGYYTHVVVPEEFI